MNIFIFITIKQYWCQVSQKFIKVNSNKAYWCEKKILKKNKMCNMLIRESIVFTFSSKTW